MATQAATLDASWYAAGGGASWTSSDQIYSGVTSSTNYRSCVRIKTGDFDGTSSYLIVSFKLNGTSSPAGMYGVLSTNGSIATNCVVSDNYYSSYTNGPHQSYLGPSASGYIAESDTYSDAACTSLQGSYNQSSGHVVYLKFSSSAIKANSTYYLYLMRYIKSGDSTSSGWTQGKRSAMTATLTYTQNTYYIDVNTYINGGGSTTTSAITYNVDINGSRKSSGVSDFYQAFVKGTTWSIACASHSGYSLASSNNTSGTLGTSSISSQWQWRSMHKLYFNANGGTNTSGGNFSVAGHDVSYGNGTSTSYVTVTYGVSNFSAMSGNIPTRTGYTFLGWYSAASGGTQIYTAAGRSTNNGTYWNSSGAWCNAADTTIYAHWQANTWTVSYNANGGKTTPGNQTKTYGTALTLASDPGHNPDTKTVTTTFNANGGSVSPASSATTATKSYTFAGWKATNGTVYSASGSYTANEGTTMTAQWTAGSWVGAAVTLPTPTRPGYTFKGWYTASSGGTKKTSYSPTENSTLYAQWTVNTYTVNIVDDYTGEVYEAHSVTYGSTITLPRISDMPKQYRGYGDGHFEIQTANDLIDVYGNCFEEHTPVCYFCYDDDGEYYDTYTHLYPGDVTLYLCYEYYGIDVFEFTMPQVAEFGSTSSEHFAYISKYSGVPDFMPNRVTATSFVRVPFVWDDYGDTEFGRYIANYHINNGAYTWLKINGQYKLGATLHKSNGVYKKVDGWMINNSGTWCTFAEHLES